MASEESTKYLAEHPEAFPMKSGDDLHSYAKNSSLQRGAIDVAKEIMTEGILKKLDIERHMYSTPNTFVLADLGCSHGPNTFVAVKNIIEVVKLKYHNQGLSSKIPEFQVLFNDHASNDFNLLFTSLSQDSKQYFVAGVPGSFYERLFPLASLHFIHTSYAIHWLSRVPKEVLNKRSLAWNKGRVHYLNSSHEVVRAYEAQYVMDMDKFLNARAHEIVFGGLMALIILGRRDGCHSQSIINIYLELLGCCLMDMVKKGIVNEEKVDSCNIPVYFMSPQEFEEAVERNGSFSIEKMKIILSLRPKTASEVCSLLRPVLYELIKHHFGDQKEIIEELFCLFQTKLEQTLPTLPESTSIINFFVLLQRKTSNNE